jgi:hypothetical protein
MTSQIFLSSESESNLRSLLGELWDEFQPRTRFEETLVEDMAAARWRRHRIMSMEKASLDHEIRKQEQFAPPGQDRATTAALAFRALADQSHSLELMNRYETRNERQFLRAHRRLLEVQDRRRNPPPSSPRQLEPPPVAAPAARSGIHAVPQARPEPEALPQSDPAARTMDFAKPTQRARFEQWLSSPAWAHVVPIRLAAA